MPISPRLSAWEVELDEFGPYLTPIKAIHQIRTYREISSYFLLVTASLRSSGVWLAVMRTVQQRQGRQALISA
jgi:hypothetical protein